MNMTISEFVQKYRQFLIAFVITLAVSATLMAACGDDDSGTTPEGNQTKGVAVIYCDGPNRVYEMPRRDGGIAVAANDPRCTGRSGGG